MKKTLFFAAMCLFIYACDDASVEDISGKVWLVKIVVDPAKSAYQIGDEVSVDYMVLDHFGKQIAGIGASWDRPDQSMVERLSDTHYRFLHLGAFDWTVTLVAPYGQRDSVTLRVPQVATNLELLVDPDKPHYRVGEQVAFDYRVYDQEGTQMTGVAATWRLPPAALAQPLGGMTFALAAEGRPSWTVALDPPWALSATRELLVDGSGPEIEVTVPERGDTILKAGQQAEVTVRGRVTDEAAGLSNLVISSNTQAAQSVTPAADGSFVFSLPAVQGLNVVGLQAEDAVGNTTYVSRAFHYSGDFFALENDTQGRDSLPGLQNVTFSDGSFDRGQAPAHDPCGFGADDIYACSEIRDVASLLELALNRIDFAGQHPYQEFNFPLVREDWVLDLTDDIQVKATLDGDFRLVLGYDRIRAGVAKVTGLMSTSGGLHGELEFLSRLNAAGEEVPGLEAAYGLSASLTFDLWLDLTATDPAVQVGLCLLAHNLCNPNPPFDCLDDYLLACNPFGGAIPIAQAQSSAVTPTLLALAADSMPASLDLAVGLDANGAADVSLQNLDVDLSGATLDASALEDLTFNIGHIRFASFEVDFGAIELSSTFISDIADQLLDPLLNALKPMVELLLEQLLGCSDENNPLCYIIPFLEKLFDAFAFQGEMNIDKPFSNTPQPVALDVDLRNQDLTTAAGQGAVIKLSGRLDNPLSQQVTAHLDDDHLGLALSNGCLAGDSPFGGAPLSGKTVQMADHLDLVNAALHAAWRAGGFDLSLDETQVSLPPELSVQALSLQLSPWLAPFITDCGAPEGKVLAEIGDCGFSGELTTLAGENIVFAGFLSAIQPARLEVLVPTVVRLIAEGEPVWSSAEITTITVDGHPAPERTGSVRQLLEQNLAPEIAARTAGAATATLKDLLPQLDISEFLALPPGAVFWMLDGLTLVDSPNHLVLNGDWHSVP